MWDLGSGENEILDYSYWTLYESKGRQHLLRELSTIGKSDVLRIMLVGVGIQPTVNITASSHFIIRLVCLYPLWNCYLVLVARPLDGADLVWRRYSSFQKWDRKKREAWRLPSRKTRDLWAQDSVFPWMNCTTVPLWTFQSVKCIFSFYQQNGLARTHLRAQFSEWFEVTQVYMFDKLWICQIITAMRSSFHAACFHLIT